MVTKSHDRDNSPICFPSKYLNMLSSSQWFYSVLGKAGWRRCGEERPDLTEIH